MQTENLPLDPVASAYILRAEDECASRLWSLSHKLILLVLVEITLLLACYVRTVVLLTAFGLLLSACLAAVVLFRLTVVLLSLLKNPEIRVSKNDVLATQHSDLPVYTILVPLYREANIAHSIISALSRLDYPTGLLDIKLILESDDELTINTVNDLNLGPEFDVVLVPAGHPRTKPKACNYALARAYGEYVVIYDAEDRPEPDQLLKVVHAFRKAPADVACLQAKLNFYNPRENFLTRSFAIEYTVWFDMILPGLQYLGAPIPLGGTSNHFRTDILQKLGAWDPFNVTEDCDLGVRLAMHRYRTLMIDSTTWEEATSTLGNWIRQRSRWVKGYMQTHLVHTKHPLSLLKTLGWLKSSYFAFTVGGVAATQLANLVLLPSTLLYLALLTVDCIQGRDPWTVVAGSRDEYRIAWKLLYLGPGEDLTWSRVSILAFFASAALLLSHLILISINLVGSKRRSYGDLWITALLSPIYWTLISVGAWRGAIQLVTRPHFWDKTMHGQSPLSHDFPAADAS